MGNLRRGIELECAERAAGKIFYDVARLEVAANVPWGPKPPKPPSPKNRKVTVVQLARFLGITPKATRDLLQRAGAELVHAAPADSRSRKGQLLPLTEPEVERAMRIFYARRGRAFLRRQARACLQQEETPAK